MKFWRLEINWITPTKEDAVIIEPLKFPVHIQTVEVKAPKKAIKKATTRKPKK